MKLFSQSIDSLVYHGMIRQDAMQELLEAYEPPSADERTQPERPVLTVAELRARRQRRREAYEQRRRQRRRA